MSGAASYVTGATLRLDGGWALRWFDEVREQADALGDLRPTADGDA